MDIRQVIARNVRAYRTDQGLSQEELAFRADLHRTYISGIERGIRNPTALTIERIAVALSVTPDKLLAAK